MQPLEYKNIKGEEHLTFDSIRRLVLHELSELNEREARKHIESCGRCQGIHLSLSDPTQVRQSNQSGYDIRPVVIGLLLVLVLIGGAAAILYFGSESKPTEEKKAELPQITESEPQPTPDLSEDQESVAPVMEAIDTIAQISEEPSIEPPLPTNKQFDEYIEQEQNQPRVSLRGIYGKITADGQPLPGVTVMIPGSGSGRVTDEGGKYYIQVPKNTRSLIFIYRGKQLIKNLDPTSRRLDIYLKSESLSFPETPDGDQSANIES